MTATTTVPTASRIVMTSTNMTTAYLEQILQLDVGVIGNTSTKAVALANYIEGGASRTYPQKLLLNLGATAASGTFTITSTGPANTQTCTIGGVTFTAVTSGATGNQFNISATPSLVAANIAAAVNASASLAGILTATSTAGVVKFTASVPGVIGNFVTLSAGTLANTTASGSLLTSGAEGDSFPIDLS